MPNMRSSTDRKSRRSAASLGSLALVVACGTEPGSIDDTAESPRRHGPSASVTGLETEAMAAPLGIDQPRPRLSWRLDSRDRGVKQAGYRVLVASSPARAEPGRADLWDSGVVTSADPFALYGGAALSSRTRYFWSVRVWLAGGADTGWAEPARFETALLGASEWRGRWIAGPERRLGRLTPEQGAADDAAIVEAGEFCRPPQWPTRPNVPLISRIPNDQGNCREIRPAPLLRKSFTLRKHVARARVYSAGLAYNDLQINGQPASDRLLDPVFTDYTRTVRYAALDVTHLLRRGENVVATELGSGKYDDATRTWDWGWDIAEWRGTPALRLDLYVTYTDGSEQVISSDESWKVSIDGPRRYDAYYLGETYDARREIRGWSRPGFDDAGWLPARIVGGPTGQLRAELSEPTRIVDTRGPGATWTPVPGVRVYDIGQNLSGWARIAVDAPAGTAIQVYYGEQLTPDGRVTDNGNNFLVGGQLQTDFYIASGRRGESFAPRFSYKGFQYVELSGPDGAPLPAGASARIERIEQVRTGMRRTSTFSAGSDLLEQIHASTDWSIQSNYVAGIITDTPVYEKNAWTGDAQLTSGIASTIFDTERGYAKAYQDMLDMQTDQGELPLLCPSNENYGYVGKPAFKPPACCGSTPAWDAFWFIVPWEAYTRFGDLRALATTYPAMRKYLDEWIPRWTDKDGDAFAHTLTSGLGDWDPPEGIETVISLATTAYYAHFARIASDTAALLGMPADAARYEELFQLIRADFNAKYLSADGIYRETPESPFTQTAQILPLAFDLAPEELRASLAARLADDVMNSRNGREFVGILGARYILPVLAAAGYPDVAYRIATHTDYPSFGYWIETLGWTALGEFWEASSRSINHHFFGSIGQWMYEDLVGMRPTAPGYAEIEFRPSIPAGLEHASARYESVRGEVAASWRKERGRLELEIRVPPNADGVVHIPAADPDDVFEVGRGWHRAEDAPGVALVAADYQRVTYRVGSGTYEFRVRTPR
jgi:alpha-L-rhamnosidase